MGDKTGIGWTNSTWNPVVGCSIKTAGCINCYAMEQAAHIVRMQPESHYAGTTKVVNGKPVWTGVLKHAPMHLRMQPLAWSKPRMIFTNSMSDLFHEDMPLEWIDEAFAVMAIANHHIYQVLTKRSARQRAYMNDPETVGRVASIMVEIAPQGRMLADVGLFLDHGIPALERWPLPHVWLGVSAERQTEANERLDDLRQTPAAIRFVSAEPLIGGLVQDWAGIDWVIIGGESGAGAREIYYSWVRIIINAAKAAGTKVFVKQMGAKPVNDLDYQGVAFDANLKHRKGEDMTEWPEEFRIQEYPAELGAAA